MLKRGQIVMFHLPPGQEDNGDRVFPAIVTQTFGPTSTIANMTVFRPSGVREEFSVNQKGTEAEGYKGGLWSYD